VITTPALLGSTFMRSQQNYQRLLLAVRYFEPPWGCFPLDPPQRKSWCENAWMPPTPKHTYKLHHPLGLPVIERVIPGKSVMIIMRRLLAVHAANVIVGSLVEAVLMMDRLLLLLLLVVFCIIGLGRPVVPLATVLAPIPGEGIIVSARRWTRELKTKCCEKS